MQTEEGNGEVVTMPGLKSRMAAYQQHTTGKKKHAGTTGKDKKKKVGKLQEKLRNPGQFESSAGGAKAHKPVFQVDNSETGCDMENAQINNHQSTATTAPGEEPVSPTRRGHKPNTANHLSDSASGSPNATGFQPHQRAAPAAVSSPAGSGGPAHAAAAGGGGALPKSDHYDFHPEPAQRGKSFDSEDGDSCARAMYGAIARNHGDTERERVAKTRLNVLLQREMRDEKVAHNYAACRVRYLRAVGNLRPVDYYGDMNDSFSFQGDGGSELAVPSPDVRQGRRTKRKTEKEKKGRYDELKQTWHSYDDVALDKPMVPTSEEAELERDLDEIEEEIHEEWEDFAEDVLQCVEEEKEAGIEEEDDDIEEWRQEQRKLQHDKEKRKKRKVERAKKREEFVEEKRKQEALEAERRKQEEEARLLQQAKEQAEEEAREKQGPENQEEKEQMQTAQEETKKNGPDLDHDHDADNEHEDPPPVRRGKKARRKKKKNLPRHNKDEKSVGEIDQKATADMVEGMGAEGRPEHSAEEYLSDLASETSGSLALQSDAAFKKRGKSMEHLGKYFGAGDAEDDDDDEEEDILAGVEVDAEREIEKDKRPRRPKREKSVDMIDISRVVPPVVVDSSNNNHEHEAPAPRKKKELRIEYDNGIPKEITIIAEGRSSSTDTYDDGSYSTISGSESSESETSCSIISAGDEDFDLDLPSSPKKNGAKKPIEKNEPKELSPRRKQKAKVDVLRIDTLPAQQFYDGTEESPFVAWTHRPLKTKIDGSQITVKVPPRTDCWRKTRHNFIMDNAPFYWHRVNGDFEVMVKVSGDMKKMYDKAGIMIRLDAENWICSGLEYFNNELNHMTCVTRDYTDWSMAPVAVEARSQGAWVCIKRIGNAYESFCSLDGRNWRQARQGLFTDAKSVRVGIFCASPMGDSYKVSFDKYRCKNLSM